MEIQNQTRLSFHGVDILNVNFNSFAPPSKDMKIEIDCEPKVFYPDDSSKYFKIIMDIDLKSKECFELILRAIGNFELDQDITPELKKSFINTNAPAIMFPYVRSFISTMTANLGNVTGTLNIPTQFFEGELEEFEIKE